MLGGTLGSILRRISKPMNTSALRSFCQPDDRRGWCLGCRLLRSSGSRGGRDWFVKPPKLTRRGLVSNVPILDLYPPGMKLTAQSLGATRQPLFHMSPGPSQYARRGHQPTLKPSARLLETATAASGDDSTKAPDEPDDPTSRLQIP